MRKLSEKALQARDAKRDLNAELLASVRDLKRGVVGRVTVLRDGRAVEVPAVKVRMAAGLSQSEFAELLGVSVRTLQGWEQGRREPTGAARVLLRIAEKNPDALRSVL
ncbi:MAG TPA: helix-turn-helix domain-containing protein [Pseudomonadales bacterium]|nr:helix-turn-helix domain-containing protein [Pseudomonadales bacterium]